MLARSSLTLVVALGITGCASSSYRVADSPRVSLVDDHGAKVYKNGKRYKDLLDAVADNPRALEEARTAQTFAAWEGGLLLGGTALDVAAVPTLIVGVKDHDAALAWTGYGLLVGALVADIGSIIMARNATPHVLDALNIYNDDAEAKMCVKRPPSAPAGAPAMPASPPP